MKREYLIRSLEEMGFKSIEAKIYCTFLEHPNATAYAVFIHLGLPRSHVYQAISEMVQKGYIMSSGNGKNQYSAVPIQKIIDAQELEESCAIQELQQELSTLPIANTGLDILEMISDYEEAIARLKEYIDHASTSISILLWEDTYQVICSNLKRAVERGVKLRVVASCTRTSRFECPFADDIYYYDEDHSLQAKIGKHWLWSVIDREIGTFGLMDRSSHTEVIFTKNLPFLQILLNYIHSYFVYRDFTEQHGGSDFLALKGGLRFSLPDN